MGPNPNGPLKKLLELLDTQAFSGSVQWVRTFGDFLDIYKGPMSFHLKRFGLEPTLGGDQYLRGLVSSTEAGAVSYGAGMDASPDWQMAHQLLTCMSLGLSATNG